MVVTGHSKTAFSKPPDVVGALMGYLKPLEFHVATIVCIISLMAFNLFVFHVNPEISTTLPHT